MPIPCAARFLEQPPSPRASRCLQRIAIWPEKRVRLTCLLCSVFSKGAFPEVRIETQPICIPLFWPSAAFSLAAALYFPAPSQEPPQQHYHHRHWEMIRRPEPLLLPSPASFLIAACRKTKIGCCVVLAPAPTAAKFLDVS